MSARSVVITVTGRYVLANVNAIGLVESHILDLMSSFESALPVQTSKPPLRALEWHSMRVQSRDILGMA